MTDEELTFETATQELNSILEKLDGDDVNIDSLAVDLERASDCLLYTSPSPRDQRGSRMPSSA